MLAPEIGSSRFGRMLIARAMWHDRMFGPPSVIEGQARDIDWDYQQADLQPGSEDDDLRDRLTQAHALFAVDAGSGFEAFHELANERSPHAINMMGELYLRGLGVPQDRQEAERWFRWASELGWRRGVLNYGRALVRRRDLDAAEAVFAASAKDDWAPASYWLAWVQLRRSWGRKALARARPLLERALEQGSPAARLLLGGLLIMGRYGLREVPRGLRLMMEDYRSLPGSPLTAGQ